VAMTGLRPQRALLGLGKPSVSSDISQRIISTGKNCSKGLTRLGDGSYEALEPKKEGRQRSTLVYTYGYTRVGCSLFYT
jgi:hypothetical protein